MSQTVLGSINVYFIKDGKVLLGRRQNKGWRDGYLCPPGGHVEPGETPRQAALREMREELGLHLTMDDLQFMCVAARASDKNDYVAYEFVVDGSGLQPRNAEPHECSELIWADIKQLPDDVIPQFREIMERSLVGHETYLELGYE